MSKPPAPIVLGIETSCDDTACALVDGRGAVLSSVVSSQLEVHRPFGGVVPEIASREHLANWPPVLGSALEAAELELSQVDAIAATRGPGLIGSLLVGLSLGKALAKGLGVPFYATNHLKGHLFSPYLRTDGGPSRPVPDRFVGLVVSGGHTVLYKVTAGATQPIAQTRDDAMGEVFDKVGKHLGLAYPQGPKVDELAEKGTGGTVEFSVARCSDGSLDFSFSGLKTQTLRELQKVVGDGSAVDNPLILNVLRSFRQAAVRQILDRLERHWNEEPFSHLAVSGGAAANRLLRRELPIWVARKKVELALVPLEFSGDNAAMIAYRALQRALSADPGDSWSIEATSRIEVGA